MALVPFVNSQISLRVFTVWSGHSLLIDIILHTFFCKRAAKDLIRLSICTSRHSMSSYVIGAIFIFRASNTSWISNELIWRFLKNSQCQSVSTPCDVWITSVRNAQTDHKSEGMICAYLFDLCSKANFSWRGQVLEGFPMVLFRISTQEVMYPTWNFWNMILLYLL